MDGVEFDVTDMGGAPAPRASAAYCVDEQQDDLLVLGGVGRADYHGDMHAMSVAGMQWRRYAGSGSLPSPRSGASACIVRLATGERRVALFGGRFEEQLLADLHTFDLVSGRWTLHAPVGEKPSAREDAVAVAGAPDAQGGRAMVLIGGTDVRREPQSDVWLYHADRGVWSRPTQAGDAPVRGLSAPAVARLPNNIAALMGGFDSKSFTSELRTLDLRTFVWRRIHVAPRVPRPRSHAAAAVIGNTLYVFGGYACSDALNDLWRVDLSAAVTEPQHSVAAYRQPGRRADGDDDVETTFTAVWERIDLPAHTSARGAACCAAGTANDGRRALVVFGGFDGAVFLDSTFVVRLGMPSVFAHSAAARAAASAPVQLGDAVGASPHRFHPGTASPVRDAAHDVDELQYAVNSLKSAMARDRPQDDAANVPPGDGKVAALERKVKALAGDNGALRRENDMLRVQLDRCRAYIEQLTKAGYTAPMAEPSAALPRQVDFDASYL